MEAIVGCRPCPSRSICTPIAGRSVERCRTQPPGSSVISPTDRSQWRHVPLGGVMDRVGDHLSRIVDQRGMARRLLPPGRTYRPRWRRRKRPSSSAELKVSAPRGGISTAVRLGHRLRGVEERETQDRPHRLGGLVEQMDMQRVQTLVRQDELDRRKARFRAYQADFGRPSWPPRPSPPGGEIAPGQDEPTHGRRAGTAAIRRRSPPCIRRQRPSRERRCAPGLSAQMGRIGAVEGAT